MHPQPIQRVALRFTLSDKTLFKISLRLHVVPLDLSNGVHPVPHPKPPTGPLPSECDGYLYRSLALLNPQPVIRQTGGFICYSQQHYRRFYVDLTKTDFAGYEQKFSSKTRSTLKRKVKKFAQHCGGTLHWRGYRSPAEIEEFYRLARAVSGKTYQEKLLDAGLPDSKAFFGEMLEDAGRDAARGYLLFHAGQPVAYLYCPIRNGVMLYQYLGYDPAYMQWSVGTVLQWCALEEIFQERKFKLFDFTEGESDHKRLFATDHVLCADVYFLKRTFVIAVLVYTHAGFNGLTAYAGRMLERFGVKTKIRKWIRFGRRT